MLSSYFDYIFVHLKQKVRLSSELSPKFLSTLGLNPTRKARPDLQLCNKLVVNNVEENDTIDIFHSFNTSLFH